MGFSCRLVLELYAAAQQYMIADWLAASVQECQEYPWVSSCSSERGLFGELNCLSCWDEYNVYAGGLRVLVRSTDWVVVVGEDDVGVDSGE